MHFNRQDMYNNYSCEHIPYIYNTIFNRVNNVCFEWGYGDTADLQFNFTFDEEEVNPTWLTKTVTITIYNFRYEEVYSTTVPGNERLVLPIDPELSLQFPRGIYYCKVTVFDSFDNSITTVIYPDNCLINVR